MSTATAAAPRSLAAATPRAERIAVLDALRGFALFGVLLANIAGMTLWIPSHLVSPGWHVDALDGVVGPLINFFIDGKSYTLLAILFGLGFAIQAEREDETGQRILPRRLLGLALIGLAHCYLMWYGDVLRNYALAGLVLYACRRRSDRTLLLAGLTLAIVVPATVVIALDVSAWPYGVDDVARRSERFHAFLLGPVGRAFHANAREAHRRFTSLQALPFTTAVTGKFLLGMWVGRRRILHDVLGNRALLRRAFWWGGAIGILGNALWIGRGALGEVVRYRYVLLTQYAVWAGLLGMGVCYGAGLALLHQRAWWRSRMRSLEALGRLSLTTYLTQSLMLILIYSGAGAGMLGKVGSTAALAMALVIFGGQLVFAQWWSRHFRMGPAEWAWRSLTYGRRQPFRLPRRDVVEPADMKAA